MRTTLHQILLLALSLILFAPSHAWGKNGAILTNIPADTGGYPYASPIFDSAGNLYFSVQGYAGAMGSVVEASPNSNGQWNISIIHAFTGVPDGSHPASSLVFDSAGNLYGTANAGGAWNAGVVFKLTPIGNGQWTESIIYSLGSGNLAIPSSGVIFDSAGNLYGEALIGGSDGAVYELSPDGHGNWTETTLYGFGAAGDGSLPAFGLVFDASGNLYGTTEAGGSVGKGTVFRLSPGAGGWTETVLYDFSADRDGKSPSGVILDSAGNLFGTTFSGGTHKGGRLYELSPATGLWQETVIHDFGWGFDGACPRGTPVFDPAGNLYGATYAGGVSGEGVVYELSPVAGGGWKRKTLHQFPYDAFDGFFPESGPILDGSGNLYGLTQDGGKFGVGVAYRLTPN